MAPSVGLTTQFCQDERTIPYQIPEAFNIDGRGVWPAGREKFSFPSTLP